MSLAVNTKIQVKADHKHHANRIGYFQFEGLGPSAGVFVFSAEPINNKEIAAQAMNAAYAHSFFATGPNDFEVLS